MLSTIGPVTVEIHGGIESDGDKITLAKLTSLGGSPHATVKLYQWRADQKNFEEFDQLIECEIAETGRHITIKGQSTRLSEEVGLALNESTVRWEVDLTGCQEC